MTDKPTGNGKIKLPDVDFTPVQDRLGAMSAEAIRASGLKMAGDVLAVGEQARVIAEKIIDDSNALALAIGEAANGLAEKIAEFDAKCKAATESFRLHRDALQQLPTLEAAIDQNRIKMATAEIDALRAVEKIIDQPTKEAARDQVQ